MISIIYMGSKCFCRGKYICHAMRHMFCKFVQTHIHLCTKPLQRSLSDSVDLNIICFVNRLYTFVCVLNLRSVLTFWRWILIKIILLKKNMCLLTYFEWQSVPVIFLPLLTSVFLARKPRLFSMHLIFLVIVPFQIIQREQF